MARENPFEPPGPGGSGGPDEVFDLGELEPLPPGDLGLAPPAGLDRLAALSGKPGPPLGTDAEDEAWAEFGSAGGGGGAGGSLDDPMLKARLSRLAPRVAVEPALDETLAAAARRKLQRRGGAVLSVAAVLLAVFLLAKAWPSGDEGDLVASGGGATTYSTLFSSTLNRGTFSPDELPPPMVDDTTPVLGSFVPGSYLPVFPTVPVTPVGTAPPQTTTTTRPPTTTTTAKPAGEVTVAISPKANAVTVGDRMTVDVLVRNDTNNAIAYLKGSSSCPVLGRVTAGPSSNPSFPIDWVGNPFIGQGAKIEDNLGANQLIPAWVLSPPAQLDAAPPTICTADLSAGTIAAGSSAAATVAFDADAAPGALANGGTLVLNVSFDYWPTTQDALGHVAATQKTVSKAVNVGWTDVGARTANMAAVYNAVNTHSGVRAVLDGPDGQPEQDFLVWVGFHRGQWVFRIDSFDLTDGSQPERHGVAKVDPNTGTVVSFS